MNIENLIRNIKTVLLVTFRFLPTIISMAIQLFEQED